MKQFRQTSKWKTGAFHNLYLKSSLIFATKFLKRFVANGQQFFPS